MRVQTDGAVERERDHEPDHVHVHDSRSFRGTSLPAGEDPEKGAAARARGDVDLRWWPAGDAVVVVPTRAEAAEMRAASPFPVLALEAWPSSPGA